MKKQEIVWYSVKEFVNTSFQRLNISSDACFIARVVAWAEMPIYE